jgi:hypothetical protein
MTSSGGTEAERPSGRPEFDRWFTIDLPVLRAIVALSDAGVEYIKPIDIVTQTGLDEPIVQRSLLALAHEDPPLFEAPGAHSGWHRQVTAVHSVTGHARRTAGTWPTKDALSKALFENILTSLEEAAEHEDDADERGRLRRTATWMGGAGRDIVLDLIASVIGKQMGI